MAHLDVLQALEQAGITVDKISGASAGVLTSIAYCMPPTEYCIEHFTRDLQPGPLYKKLPKGRGLYLLIKYRTKSWGRMLHKRLFDLSTDVSERNNLYAKFPKRVKELTPLLSKSSRNEAERSRKRGRGPLIGIPATTGSTRSTTTVLAVAAH